MHRRSLPYTVVRRRLSVRAEDRSSRSRPYPVQKVSLLDIADLFSGVAWLCFACFGREGMVVVRHRYVNSWDHLSRRAVPLKHSRGRDWSRTGRRVAEEYRDPGRSMLHSYLLIRDCSRLDHSRRRRRLTASAYVLLLLELECERGYPANATKSLKNASRP